MARHKSASDSLVSPRVDNRREALLEAAAQQFSTRGFAGTSIRDIASAVGMLPGSIYYHFKSKEDLLLAVHEEGVAHILDAVQTAIARVPEHDTWGRLEAACCAHLEALLGEKTFSQVVTPQFTRSFDEPLRTQLVAQRDRYERIFSLIIDGLSLPAAVDRRYFRLTLLGSLNWTTTWYRKGRHKPATIARNMLVMYRYQLDLTAAFPSES